MIRTNVSQRVRAAIRNSRDKGTLHSIDLLVRRRVPKLYRIVQQSWRSHDSVFFNVFGDDEKGKPRVALSYMLVPFYMDRRDIKFANHSNLWRCLEIAKIFRELGFIVDAIDGYSDGFALRKKYDIFFDDGLNLDKCGSKLPAECIKIRYATGQHWIVRNKAELERLDRIRRTRGVVLQPKRALRPGRADTIADALIYIGNERMKDSYSHVKCPTYPVPVPGAEIHFDDYERNLKEVKSRYLWIGSGGMAHKGLDLVLEAFSRMPELKLEIVGPVDKEPEFFSAFCKELQKTSNIKVHGFINIGSDEFQEIARSCVAMVYPTCSEGTGSVNIASMAKGLIPIVSKESCIDVGEGGIILRDCEVDTIIKAVRNVSRMEERELRYRSTQVRELVMKRHTGAEFSRLMRESLEKILNG